MAKRQVKNRMTGEVRTLDDSMDVRIWDLLPEKMKPRKGPRRLTLQRFEQRDRERKDRYYRFFPWAKPVSSDLWMERLMNPRQGR